MSSWQNFSAICLPGSRNWAIEWQADHTGVKDRFDCHPVHTQAVDGNLKGYAAC